MNNLVISYDLHQPGQDYKAIEEAIESLGDAVKIHLSVYCVHTKKSAKEAMLLIHPFMDANDTLFVVDATNNKWAGWLEQRKHDALHRFW